MMLNHLSSRGSHLIINVFAPGSKIHVFTFLFVSDLSLGAAISSYKDVYKSSKNK